MRVVLTALERCLSHELLEDREEVVDQLVHLQLLGPNRQFKCLEDGFERAQARSLVSLICLRQALRDLLDGVLGPGGEVQLRNVVDDVLDRADDHLACWVGQVHHVV